LQQQSLPAHPDYFGSNVEQRRMYYVSQRESFDARSMGARNRPIVIDAGQRKRCMAKEDVLSLN
jgi:hypothetical protein